MPPWLKQITISKAFASIVCLALLITVLPNASAGAVDLGASYVLMQRDYPEMIDRLKAGGATDADIESFLTDLESDVTNRGTLTQANFNTYMYQSIEEVVSWRKHRIIFRALMEQFGDEIEYYLDNDQLHPDLLPIRNAVMGAVFGNGSPGGGGGIIPPQPPTTPLDTIEAVNQEIERQLRNSEDFIELNAGDNPLVTISSSSLKDIGADSRDLVIKFTGVSLELPPNSLALGDNNTLSLSAAPVDKSKQDEILKKTSSYYKLLGSIFEISATTQSSMASVTFSKPITVTFSYSGISLVGINENNLDIFYYNEAANQWEKMNGIIDKSKKIINFTTTHFSKYALMSYTPVVDSKFADLAGHWAENDINIMVSQGLVSGIDAAHFAPDAKITRAEFAALLIRALSIPESSLIMGQFKDVPAGKWYFNTVNTASKSGLITGYDSITFGPEDPVTREQIAVMLKKALVYKSIAVNTDKEVGTILAQYNDNHEISAWARDSVVTTINKGIIYGRTPTQFAPGASATRAEAAVMILRTYNQF